MNETKCDVIFVNSVGANESVYYSGQKITGSVVISIYDKLEIKGIRMNHDSIVIEIMNLFRNHL